MTNELEQKLEHARQMLASAERAVEAADRKRAHARELGGGLLSFGPSGPQGARRRVQSATEAGLRASFEAEQRVSMWRQKVRLLEARIAAATRERYTRDELVGADLIHDGSRWRVVVTVNKTTVSVATGYSWTDRIPFDRVHDVRHPE